MVACWIAPLYLEISASFDNLLTLLYIRVSHDAPVNKIYAQSPSPYRRVPASNIPDGDENTSLGCVAFEVKRYRSRT